MSRSCKRCPTSSMKRGRRHLHELEPGDRFRFDGRPDIVRILVRLGFGRAVIRDTKEAERTLRDFVTSDGKRVQFRAGPKSTERPCSPVAQVVKIER